METQMYDSLEITDAAVEFTSCNQSNKPLALKSTHEVKGVGFTATCSCRSPSIVQAQTSILLHCREK